MTRKKGIPVKRHRELSKKNSSEIVATKEIAVTSEPTTLQRTRRNVAIRIKEGRAKITGLAPSTVTASSTSLNEIIVGQKKQLGESNSRLLKLIEDIG